MTTQLTDVNDLNKYTQGTPVPVEVPNQYVLSEAVEYNDALEFSSVTDKVRKATGAAGSRYLGVCLAGGGQSSGDRPTIGRSHVISMVIAVGSAAVNPGDKLRAATATTCAKVTQNYGPYTFDQNIFGEALEDGVAGATIKVRVDPVINQ